MFNATLSRAPWEDPERGVILLSLSSYCTTRFGETGAVLSVALTYNMLNTENVRLRFDGGLAVRFSSCPIFRVLQPAR